MPNDITQLTRNHPVVYMIFRDTVCICICIVSIDLVNMPRENACIYLGSVAMLSFKLNLLDRDVPPISLGRDEGEVKGEEEGD